MTAPRFLVDMSASCETCGCKLVLTMPPHPVANQNALAHAFVAHAKIRTWIIDHAKTCKGAR